MERSITIVRELVDPPIRRGVLSVRRVRERGQAVSVQFNPPRADLLDTDFDSMSDNEIAALGRAGA